MAALRIAFAAADRLLLAGQRPLVGVADQSDVGGCPTVADRPFAAGRERPVSGSLLRNF